MERFINEVEWKFVQNYLAKFAGAMEMNNFEGTRRARNNSQ